MGEEYTPLSLRLRRATSWGLRGDEEEDKDQPDHDTAFIFYWIAFNALYAEDTTDYSETSEQEALQRCLSKIDYLDKQDKQPWIYKALQWNINDVRDLLNNQYIFRDFGSTTMA